MEYYVLSIGEVFHDPFQQGQELRHDAACKGMIHSCEKQGILDTSSEMLLYPKMQEHFPAESKD